jgi:hypothetical protein
MFSLVLYAIHYYETTGARNAVVCGEGDLRPCPPGVTPSTFSVNTFTPPGCAMSDGILTCTGSTVISQTFSLGLMILVIGVFLGILAVIEGVRRR